MPIAAVPSYLGQDFSDASPGLRFGMFLRLWGVNRRSHAHLWSKQDIGYEVRGQDRQEREVTYDNKAASIREACTLTGRDQDTLLALLSRQRAAFAARAAAQDGFSIEARAIAPFTTGLGNEHPLENGFAFLNPYGLPYLAGSGVKGVIRRAAQELAEGKWDKTKGWSNEPRYRLEIDSGKEKRTIALSMLDVLFGREPASGDSDHVRGALTFWDVIPQIAGNSLMVEIMTPHQSHYYQWKKDARNNLIKVAPHESGQPTPISFLTVPPGSTFVFHVVCDHAHLARLAPDLAQRGDDGRPRWQTLIEEAFKHAFAWLGFGAKTAVGYGAMRITGNEAEQPDTNKDKTATATRDTVQIPIQEELWPTAKLTLHPGTGEIKASYQGKVTAGLKGQEMQNLLTNLGDRANKLKKDKELKNVSVRVRREGNLNILIGIEN